MMRWGTLFSNFGGADWGLEAAGDTVVWAVENDPMAAEYYLRNHPKSRMMEADVQSVDVRELPNIDALWISPPCQGHSQARRKDLPARDDVWVGRDMLRYVAELRPAVIIIENVPKYAKHAVFREIIAALESPELGYTVEWRVLNCADYGIPQTRERLIVQARRDGCITWPAMAARRIGWYEAIGDILPPPDKPLAPWQASRWNEAYSKLGVTWLDNSSACRRNPKGRDNVLTVRAVHEPVATITTNHHGADFIYPLLLDGQFKYGSDETGNRILNPIAPDQPAPCIMASDHSRKDIVYPVTVPMRARMTARCAARLQTLPDSAILPEVYSHAIKLIGNAVPSLLAQRLAENLKAHASTWQPSMWQINENEMRERAIA